MATLGKMSEHIDLIQPVVVKDAAGFATTGDEIIASVRAYMEVRHASGAWVNRAAYTKADLLLMLSNTSAAMSRFWLTAPKQKEHPDG